MNRIALLLCAAIIAAACFSCVQTQQALLSGMGTGSANCTAKQFADAVQVLGANSIPVDLNPPTGATTPLGSNTQTWQDLAAAFNAAPPAFQQKLCLTTVYINPDSCTGNPYSCFGPNSWGLRNPNNITQHYLALSQALWSGGTAPPYSQAETNILAQLMLTLGMPWPESAQSPKRPTFSPAMNSTTSVDTPALTVLAALSHEYGHVLWYDLLKGNNANYDPNAFCQQTGKKFFDNAWHTPVNTPPSWLYFGNTTNDQHATGTVKIQDLRNAINANPPDFKEAARLLDKLYDSDNNNPSGVWASLFGAISPAEDFVETFKIYILTDPSTNKGTPVTSMPLNIYAALGSAPKYTSDIFADLAAHKKKELARKISCISTAFLSTTPSAR